MKKIKTMIAFAVLFLFCMSSVLALPEEATNDAGAGTPVQDSQTIMFVNQQHDKTRQHMTTQHNNAIEEFTKRADYYESSFQKIANGVVIKLVLGVLGVMLFVSAFGYFLRLRSEKRKYQVMKEGIFNDIVGEVKKEFIVFPKEVQDKLEFLADAKRKEMGADEPIEKTFMKKLDEKLSAYSGKKVKKKGLFGGIFSKRVKG